MKTIEFPDFWVSSGSKMIRRHNPDTSDSRPFQYYENGKWCSTCSTGLTPWQAADDPEKTKAAIAPKVMGPAKFVAWMLRTGRGLKSRCGGFELRIDHRRGVEYGNDCGWAPATSVLTGTHRLVPADGEPWGDE